MNCILFVFHGNTLHYIFPDPDEPEKSRIPQIYFGYGRITAMNPDSHVASHIARILAFKITFGKANFPDGRLPAVRELATLFGASTSTIVKALALLELRGYIERRRGRGGCLIRAEGSVHDPLPMESFKGSRPWQLAKAILKWIGEGGGGKNGVLPSARELARQFGCSQRTAHSALEQLREKGSLVRAGRRYAVGRANAAPPGGARVYLIGPAQVMRRLTGRYGDYVKSLESRLAELQWPAPAVFAADDPAAVDAPRGSRVSAFVHLDHGQGRRWNPFYRACAPIPVVALQTSGSDRSLYSRGYPLTAIRPDDAWAGQCVANHCVSTGRTSVAFLSPVDFSPGWLMHRINGLQEGLRSSAGEQCRLVKIAVPTAKDGLPALAGNAWKAAGEVKRSVLDLAPEITVWSYTDSLSKVQSLFDVAARAQSVFAETLAMPGISVWVCINDELAISALFWLKKRGVDVPGRIAVIGFDNTSLARASDLTSFDFAFEKMGFLAAECIVHPRAAGVRCEYVRGALVVRGSSAAGWNRG